MRTKNPFTQAVENITAEITAFGPNMPPAPAEPFMAAPPTRTGPRSELRKARARLGIRLEHLQRG